MGDRTVTYEELKELSGYNTPIEVALWMDQHGIAKFMGKHNRPSTTIGALDTALGISYDSQPQSRVVGL